MKKNMSIENKKRKVRKINDDDDDSDYFKIEDYKITNLKSLIDLTYDLMNKDPPPKRIKKNYHQNYIN